MPNEHPERLGLLVLRAFADGDVPPRLIVRVLEVHPAGADRVIGVVDSSAAATHLVGRWLDALASGRAGARRPAPGDPPAGSTGPRRDRSSG